MRIVQIACAHIEQGSEPCLYGLDEVGQLWEWIPDMKPAVGRRQKFEPVPQEEAEKLPEWMKRPSEDGTLMRPMVDPVTKQQILENVYSDGNTAGWKLIGISGQVMKKYPHPEDPTRHDRA
jgi:hypothetical protein